jgi:hypothetical protein
MDYIGFDLGTVASRICVITEDGELIERRIKTDRKSLSKLFGGRAPARVLIETGTESEWVARHLEGFGHEVVVADTNFAAMYATRSRRVKTDKRDARALAEACRLGAYRPAHRASDARRAGGPRGDGEYPRQVHHADLLSAQARRLPGLDRRLALLPAAAGTSGTARATGRGDRAPGGVAP